jgi:hypothetical protein
MYAIKSPGAVEDLMIDPNFLKYLAGPSGI